MAPEPPPYLYEETYRGIGFFLTAKNVWVFAQIPPGGGWWSHYCKPSDPPSAEGMRMAIDRCLARRI